MAQTSKKHHVIFGNVDYVSFSTDNNCVSISIDFGKNIGFEQINTADAINPPAEFEASRKIQPCKTVINRARMILSERETSQKQFTALKSRSSFFSVLKFETGAVIVVGLQEPALINLCVSKAVTDIADTLKYPICIRNVSIVNTVSTFNRFHLDFTRICAFFDRHCIAYIYNPETFPGMFFKLRVPAKKLEDTETLGEYYTKVASMRDKESSFNVNEWFRVKTVLTFKVGKNTILGECGRDDVSVISKLLFGLFHYFMDQNIKLSPNEARRIRDRYGIPSLEWYLYVDIFFHSHPYVKPTKEEVRLSIIDSFTTIDEPYYGNSTDSSLSANLVPSGEETSKITKAMIAQKLCGPSIMHRKSVVGPSSRGRWRKVPRPEPFSLLYVNTSTTNGESGGEWCLGKKITNLCYQEIVKECETDNFIPAAFIRDYLPTESQKRLFHVVSKSINSKISLKKSSFYSGTSQSNKMKQKEHSVTLARLDTHLTAYKFLNDYLVSGFAPNFAQLFGTDVYSLLHLVKKIPKARGHSLSLGGSYKTPGDVHFSRLFDESNNIINEKKKCISKNSSTTPSRFNCQACGEPLIKNSISIEHELCQACDEQSTNYIENALSIIRKNSKKRGFDEDAICNEISPKSLKNNEKCTPSDFINSVFKFKDELTGAPKVGLEFRVKDILNSLSSARSMEDRPTANYRTTLHADTQNKCNLNKLLVIALKENGATEDEAHVFNSILNNRKGLSILRELANEVQTKVTV